MLFSIKRWFYAVMLGIALSQTVALADITIGPSLPVGLSLPSPGYVFCYEGGPCVAPWTGLALPMLMINESLQITTDSADFKFYLGDNLSGDFVVSLTPFYVTNSSPVQDELLANIATSEEILGVTTNGVFNLSASGGTQYYLLLSGLVRGDETYSLSVSAVPEPSQFIFLSIGLGLLVLRTAGRTRS